MPDARQDDPAVRPFLPWATREFRWTPRHVERHLLLVRHATRVSHLGPEASLRAALAAIGPAARGELTAAEATRYVPWLAQTFQSGSGKRLRRSTRGLRSDSSSSIWRIG